MEPTESQRMARKINLGVAWAAASQAIVAISDLISQLVVVAVWLTNKQYGITMMAVPLYSILDCAADLGVTSALIQRDDHTPERISTVFWFNTLLSGALFGLLCIAGPLYGNLQGYDVVGWLLIAYGGKLLAQNFYAIPYALLRKQMQFEEVAKIRTIAYLTESVTRIVFAASGWTVWCFTLAAIAKTVVFAILMQWRHPYWPRLVFRWREVESYVRFGVRSAASSLLYYTYTALDMPIVAYFFGAAANGLYALADWIVLEAVKTIANVMIDVAYPTFARMRDDRDGVIREFIKLTRLSLIAILPFVVLVALVVPEFLHAAYGNGKWSDVTQPSTVCGDGVPDPVRGRRPARARLHRPAAARRHRPARPHAALHDRRVDPRARHVHRVRAAARRSLRPALGRVRLGDRLSDRVRGADVSDRAVDRAAGAPLPAQRRRDRRVRSRRLRARPRGRSSLLAARAMACGVAAIVDRRRWAARSGCWRGGKASRPARSRRSLARVGC